MYDVMEIASYVFNKCNKMKLRIDNMRLQAILYYVQTEFLITKGIPCFNDEILVERSGPKVSKVFNNYCYLSNDKFIKKGKIKNDDLQLIDRVIMATRGVSSDFLYEEIRGQIPWLNACDNKMIINLEVIKDNCSKIHDMSYLYKVMDISNYVIWKCNNDNKFISTLKLMKLLYFIQAQFLVEKNISCFKEDILAYDFGPVVEDVYYKYRFFLGSHIPISNDGKVYYNFFNKPEDVFYIELGNRKVIDEIVEDTYSYSNTTLLDVIRNQTPWLETYYRSKSKVISRGLLKSYFEEK